VLRLDPAVIGVHPGEIEAEIVFRNEFSDGSHIEGTLEGEIDATMEPTFIASLSPEEASRGEVVEIIGRGFVDGDGSGVGMTLRFEGGFEPDDPNDESSNFLEYGALE